MPKIGNSDFNYQIFYSSGVLRSSLADSGHSGLVSGIQGAVMLALDIFAEQREEITKAKLSAE